MNTIIEVTKKDKGFEELFYCSKAIIVQNTMSDPFDYKEVLLIEDTQGEAQEKRIIGCDGTRLHCSLVDIDISTGIYKPVRVGASKLTMFKVEKDLIYPEMNRVIPRSDENDFYIKIENAIKNYHKLCHLYTAVIRKVHDDHTFIFSQFSQIITNIPSTNFNEENSIVIIFNNCLLYRPLVVVNYKLFKLNNFKLSKDNVLAILMPAKQRDINFSINRLKEVE